MINKEKRYIQLTDNLNLRAETTEEGKKYIGGYASVFNQRSKLIFENGKTFFEVIERNAFDNVLQSEDLDVLLTYQHNMNEPISRLNKAKAIDNLTLETDDTGLKYSAVLPNTRLANDIFELIQTRSLFENSFIFTVDKERWEKDEEGNNIRYIESVSGLYDVSVVVNGAYANTDLAVAQRNLEAQQEEEKEQDVKEIEEKKIFNERELDKIKNEILQIKYRNI